MAKCIHHFDHDGRGGAAMIRFFTPHEFKKEDYIEMGDYKKPIPLDKITKDEAVYIIDYSFSEHTVDRLRELLKITKNIVWIDHHQSSIDLEEKYPEFKNIEGIRKVGICGMALTYMYFRHIGKLEDLPYYIQLIDDYDCWKLKFKESTYLKLGLEIEGFEPWADSWQSLQLGSIEETYFAMDDIVEKGKLVKHFVDMDNKFHLEQASYETEIEGLKCIVINRRSNSWIFGEKINEYPIVMVYYYNGERYFYSLFTQNPEIDCCKIATKFGGGGHKGAAGFSSKKLLFRKKSTKLLQFFKKLFKKSF